MYKVWYTVCARALFWHNYLLWRVLLRGSSFSSSSSDSDYLLHCLFFVVVLSSRPSSREPRECLCLVGLASSDLVRERWSATEESPCAERSIPMPNASNCLLTWRAS